MNIIFYTHENFDARKENRKKNFENEKNKKEGFISLL
jgi:hypothetical protein